MRSTPTNIEVNQEILDYLMEKAHKRYGYITEGSLIAEKATITCVSNGNIIFQPFEFFYDTPHWVEQCH